MATVTQTVQDVPRRVLPKYEQAKESKFDLDWADLITLDLSQFDQPGGKQKLANQLRDAVHKVGFFYVRSCQTLPPAKLILCRSPTLA